MKPRKIFYFAATHWDREWYRTVDEFRFRLVRVMDQVIRTLQTEQDFELFTLDGQTCPLEDYLTVREEKRPELERLIREGKLAVGPWFTMPDEYLVSSESLVQNLLRGHAIADSWGAKVLKAGYVCDIFGHIANFPQILRGFGIDNALISRGTNDSELECFFEWEAPDGSKVLTFKAPEICGYGSFFWEVICPYGPDYTSHLDGITEKAIAYVERELTRTSLPYVILMDGMDHETIHEFMPQVLRRLEEHFGCPVVQKRLDEVSAEIMGDMPLVMGELNSHCRDNVMHNKLIPHTLSSRYDLKRANDACQNILEHYAMPCAALLRLDGKDPEYSYINHAYHYLLQNHAHDSICGCSIAAVHRHMLTRFERTWYTANEYFLQYCSLERDRTKSTDHELVVKVFNPLPYAREGLVEMNIDFPEDFPASELPYIKYEQRNAFRILNEQGEVVPYNIVSAARGSFIRSLHGGKQVADTHRVALTASLRPMGYTSFRVVPADKPYRILDRFSTGPDSCENDFIRFRIHSDGTVQITDKETGHCYDRLHSFLDCAETGDGWFHIRPIQDRVISSLGCPVSIEKTFDGYAACKFLVRYRWSLPEMAERRQGFGVRGGNYVPFDIESEFTVSRTSKVVTVKTKVHNSAKDHRLQLHLPTGVSAQKYYVNQCNLILERPCGFNVEHYEWKEADISEYPLESMAFLREGDRGLLFLSGGGLHEISCPGDSENSMDITLLRCFEKTTGTNGEPEGQLPGEQVFSYAWMPISKENHRQLVTVKDQFVSGYREFTMTGSSQTAASGLTVSSDNCAYITCLPGKQGGVIVRLANYCGEADSCTVTFSRKAARACLCDFLENPTEEVNVRGNQVSITVPPYKMVNLQVWFSLEVVVP